MGEAFAAAAGFTPEQLARLISLGGGAIATLFAGYVIYTAYRGWAEKSINGRKLFEAVVRMALLLAITISILTI